MTPVLIALALAAQSPSMARPACGGGALASGWAAAREMGRLAVTADERALARSDLAAMTRAQAMIDRRCRAAGGASQDQFLNATKQMQETQMSFNLQYLQLQSQMQHENRSYTAISNIMKTKHDTVKNSISNVR